MEDKQHFVPTAVNILSSIKMIDTMVKTMCYYFKPRLPHGLGWLGEEDLYDAVNFYTVRYLLRHKDDTTRMSIMFIRQNVWISIKHLVWSRYHREKVVMSYSDNNDFNRGHNNCDSDAPLDTVIVPIFTEKDYGQVHEQHIIQVRKFIKERCTKLEASVYEEVYGKNRTYDETMKILNVSWKTIDNSMTRIKNKLITYYNENKELFDEY